MTSHVFIPLCVVRCLRCCSQGDRRCECANQNKSHHVLSVERLPRCLRAQKTVCICHKIRCEGALQYWPTESLASLSDCCSALGERLKLWAALLHWCPAFLIS